MKTTLLALLLAAVHAYAAPMTLVKEGKPTSVIVLGKKHSGTAKEAADILADHLKQISGATVPVAREGQLGGVAVDGGQIRSTAFPDAAAFLLVGESGLAARLGADASDFAPGEMQIKTVGNALLLLGADDRTPTDRGGTRYAVTAFLEDALGVRFLWPGELGKVVPKRATVTAGDIDTRIAPRILQRRIRIGASYGERMAKGGDKIGITADDFKAARAAASKTASRDGGWARWNRLGGSLNLVSGHSFGDYWERFGKLHPEWFAMAPNGSRDQSGSPDRARLCVSNRELIAQVAADRIARLDANPKQKSVTIGPNDGGTTSFCVCEECKKLDPPEGRPIRMVDFSPGANRRPFDYVSLTDRYVHFFNAVAEKVVAKHPDVTLTADAYGVYAAPPVKAKLHPNIAIRYVGVTYTDDEKRERGIADWHAWQEAAKKIYFRSNLLLAGRRQGTPVVYVHKLAEDFSGLAEGMIGTDLDSCCHNWATQGINYYAMARLLWDPDLDIDALLDDYCRAGFGAGAVHVKAYLLEVESLTNLMATTEMKYTGPFTHEAIAGLRGHLDKAHASTAGDTGSNKRVAFLRAGLEYTDAFCEIFRIDRERQEKGEKMTAEWRQRIGAACDRNWEVSREMFEKHHLAVNIPNVAWGSWDYFGRFGWEPPVAASDPGADN